MAIIKNDILEAVGVMSAMELNDPVKTFEERFGVSAAAMAVVGPAAAGGAVAAEEQTEFTVTLKGAGTNKIGIIRAVREITDLGLKEAKDLVDGVPELVKKGAGKKTADELVKKPVEAGAEAEAE